MSTSTPPPVPSTPAAPSAAALTAPLTAPLTELLNALLGALRPTEQIADMSDPMFAIEHLARLFKLEVDSAREQTYRTDFPQPIKIGRRWLWFPDEVLAWSHKQKRFTVAERKRNTPAPEPAAVAPKIKPYKARAKKSSAVAA